LKTISANLQTHLNGSVTTLATIWRIVRTDTVEEFYTTHDQPIVYDGDTYTPIASSFSETAVAGKADLSVDNLEVDVILGAVSRDDIMAGIYDHSEVYFAIINYKTPADGLVKLKRGWFGEAVLQRGVAKIELRGLMESLQHPMMEFTSPTCRAAFGDTRCGKSLSSYTVTGTTTANIFPDKFDYTVGTGLPAGYTHRFGGTGVYSITAPGWPILVEFGGNLLNSDWSNAPNITADYSNDMQFVSIDAADGFDDVHIIAKVFVRNWSTYYVGEYVGVRVSETSNGLNGYFLVTADGDPGSVVHKLIKIVDGTVTVLATVWTWWFTWGQQAHDFVWELRAYGSSIKCRVWRANETKPEAWTYETTDTSVPSGDYTGIGNLIKIEVDFVSVGVAGATPDYSMDAGQEASDSFYDTALTQAAGYFDAGKIEFTGPSASPLVGLEVEVKTYDATTKLITLWEPMPDVIAYGTTYEMSAGCDKTLATCRDRFDNVVSFRGEPHLPGQDVIASSPNYSEQ
jgi:hypothetical protein